MWFQFSLSAWTMGIGGKVSAWDKGCMDFWVQFPVFPALPGRWQL